MVSSILKSYLPIGIFCLVGTLSFAQPTNDNCNKAIVIKDIIKYCSKVGEFSNEAATPSGYGTPGCWSNTNGDVWFKFRAFFTEVSITINGANTQNNGGSLRLPQVALYSGVCGGTLSEIRCVTDVFRTNVVSFQKGGLTIGNDYLIRVDGFNGNKGTFQICLNNYNPPADPGQDCPTAAVLCDKSPFVIQKLSGPGRDIHEADNTCLGAVGSSEEQSAWYSWTAATSGTLTFTLKPLNGGDDLDFALFELPNGVKDCSNKILLRCNATHPVGTNGSRLICGDSTGLDLTSTDIEEDFNCDKGEDGFCKYIDMVAGKSYTLVINNWTQSGNGFSVDFGGTGEFEGPKADFDVIPTSGLRCETDFKVIDLSSIKNGTISEWHWNFGKDAVPPTKDETTGGNTHIVNYKSFGDKYVTLTVVSNNGCKVTDVFPIFAEPCCEDLPTLTMQIDSLFDTKCFHSNDGRILAEGSSGNPYSEKDANGQINMFYQFSIDGETFTPLRDFTNLPPGDYNLFIQDRKGCLDSLSVHISEPPPIIPDVGQDLEVELGNSIDLSTTVNPSGFYFYNWIKGDSVLCRDCQNSSAIPFNDGYYTMKVIDDKGCMGFDSLFVRVKKQYDVWTPNVFSPNGDHLNDKFSVFGKKAVESILSLQIYDRWGNMLYDGKNVTINDPQSGWDGMFRGQKMNPGTYVYVAKVKFLDGVVKNLAGDITIIQ